MLFNSWTFVLFAVIVISVYYTLRWRAQNVMLLLASYVFYGAWDWRFLLLLWLSTVIDYAVGLGLGSPRLTHRRKLLITASITAQLGILGFFKYFNFFSDSAVQLLQHFGLSVWEPTLRVVLPVGVSFYTFQSMSYTIDVYRRRLEPVRNLLDFSLFVSFFPQLVAGPIERATEMLPQIRAPRRVTRECLVAGAWLVLWGYFKKIVIADNLSPVVDQVYNASSPQSAWNILLATYAFAIQIYCDFSGYTDIARGLAKLMGFHFSLNFRLPYLARNPSDFWSRWHISLSTWLRDYLYIPLGGNRKGEWITRRNLMLTMLLGGLWHGAAWNFVIWGAYQGALLLAYRVLSPPRKTPAAAPPREPAWLPAVQIVIMFHLVCVGWFFFRASSLHQIVQMAGWFFTDWHLSPASLILLSHLLLFILMLGVIEWWIRNADDPRTRPLWRYGAGPLVATLLVLGILIFAPDSQQTFLYFQF